MLFNSSTFVWFAVVVYGVYYLLGRRAQNVFLLIASYVFYGAWDWRFLLLLWLSTLIDFGVGIGLGKTQTQHHRKILLGISLTAQLSILAFFKYFNFFADSAVHLLTHFGVAASAPALQVVLPVGVSFYTFQTMGYTIDVYRRRHGPARNLLDFALFVAFFPQLVAGPIERAGQMLPQIRNPRRLTGDLAAAGAWLVLWGYFKKIVIADNLSPIVDQVFNSADHQTGPKVLIATYAFAFQIYCDFSGYTDIARGLAKLLGFELMINFQLPYLAQNPSDFWKRWHISLSTWLRDYLYIPLGGNRGGTFKTCRNLMLTMLLGGLWHGAAWNFVLWGAFHGLLLVGYRLMSGESAAIRDRASAPPWRAALNILIMFNLVCVGWFFFRANSLEQIVRLGSSCLSDLRWTPTAAAMLGRTLVFAGMLFMVEAWVANAEDPRTRPLWNLGAGPVMATLMIIVMVIYAPEDQRSFFYFQF